jgi:hypothetical protein
MPPARIEEEEARAALARLRARRPELFRPPRRPGHARGLTAMKPEALPRIYARAAGIFLKNHGRLPDLAAPDGLVEHIFAVKFTHAIPLRPNPADKLNAGHYLRRALRARVGLPGRPWSSEDPVLPPDDAVPPGRYWLKKSLGNAMQARVEWPPSPERRARLQRRVEAWWARRYGVEWGEWWYALSPARLFLERDLSARMEGRAECRIICRGGRARFVALHRTLEGGERVFSLFDRAFRPLPGGVAGHRSVVEPAPEALSLMIEAAEDIARHFEFIRVDFLNIAGARPGLGELTLCPGNATQHYAPEGFDRTLGRLVFG